MATILKLLAALLTFFGIRSAAKAEQRDADLAAGQAAKLEAERKVRDVENDVDRLTAAERLQRIRDNSAKRDLRH